MKKLHIVGNWKMSLNKEDSLKLAHNIKLINNKDNLNIEVAPTSLYLAEIAEILKDSDISVISQNFDFQNLGSFTGGICLDQLKEIGVNKTILGHSERRSNFNESNEQINNKLGLQVSYLTEIARKHNIPILITNQVYADFDEKDAVKMVGGDILKYGSKCLLELLKFKTKRAAVLKKHRSIKEGKKVVFEITSNGFEEEKEKFSE